MTNGIIYDDKLNVYLIIKYIEFINFKDNIVTCKIEKIDCPEINDTKITKRGKKKSTTYLRIPKYMKEGIKDKAKYLLIKIGKSFIALNKR